MTTRPFWCTCHVAWRWCTCDANNHLWPCQFSTTAIKLFVLCSKRRSSNNIYILPARLRRLLMFWSPCLSHVKHRTTRWPSNTPIASSNPSRGWILTETAQRDVVQIGCRGAFVEREPGTRSVVSSVNTRAHLEDKLVHYSVEQHIA